MAIIDSDSLRTDLLAYLAGTSFAAFAPADVADYPSSMQVWVEAKHSEGACCANLIFDCRTAVVTHEPIGDAEGCLLPPAEYTAEIDVVSRKFAELGALHSTSTVVRRRYPLQPPI